MAAKYTGQQKVDHAATSPSPFVGRQRELNLIWNYGCADYLGYPF